MDKKDIVAIAVLFLISFYVRTLPLQNNTMPFGENDAAHQFGKFDAMSWMDKAPREMPHFLAMWYRHNPNDFYAPIYPAPAAINLASMQILGQDRFQPTNIYYAIATGFLTVAAAFLIMRRLFGFLPAFLSGFFVIFMMRNTYFYIWGQRPAMIALSFVPISLYCFYRYAESYLDGRENPVYLYVMALVLGGMSVLHPTSTVAAAFIIGVLTVALWVKHKKMPFSIKQAVIAAIIFAAVFAPFLLDITSQTGVTKPMAIPLSSFLKWYQFPGVNPPNAHLYSFSQMNGGYWTIPFMLLGILFLVLRRRDKDIVMLSWVFGLYLVLHLGTIIVHSRTNRMLAGSAAILWPLAVLGLLAIPSLLGLKKPIKTYVKYGLIVVFILLVWNFNAKPNMDLLSSAYPAYMRVTPAQLAAVEWIDANLPEHALLYIAGPLNYAKQQWMHVMSHRAMQTEAIFKDIQTAEEAASDIPINNKITHAVIDYSDAAIFINSNNEGAIQQGNALAQHLLSVENSLNGTVVYDANNVKVIEIG